MNKFFYLDKLNDKQKKAVETLNGPVLVLAGAGTGKTRVLTTRLAHLLNKKFAKPWEIFAVTFTNKAANEMKERVQNLLKIDIERMWIGTFHSTGLKILRRHAELCFLKNDFTVIDTDDQTRLVKQVLESNKIDIKKYTPSNVLWMIQWFKDKAIFAEESNKYKFKFGRTLNISKLYIEYGIKIEIVNPILNLSKAQIIKLGKELDAPIHLTWSCYQEGDEPCGACESCKIRSSGFEQAGFQDLTQP